MTAPYNASLADALDEVWAKKDAKIAALWQVVHALAAVLELRDNDGKKILAQQIATHSCLSLSEDAPVTAPAEPLAPMDTPDQRKAWVCQEVAALLRKDVPLAFALSTVQSMANTYCRGLDIEYGPFLDVEKIWALSQSAEYRTFCEHGTPDPDNGGDPCHLCAMGA